MRLRKWIEIVSGTIFVIVPLVSSCARQITRALDYAGYADFFFAHSSKDDKSWVHSVLSYLGAPLPGYIQLLLFALGFGLLVTAIKGDTVFMSLFSADSVKPEEAVKTSNRTVSDQNIGKAHQTALEQAGGDNGTFPDWPIRELFSYMDQDHLDGTWETVGSVIMDGLSLGKVRAWGREIAGSRRLPPTEIPATYWREAKFTYSFFKEDHSEKDEDVCARGGLPSFADLSVNKLQAQTALASQRAAEKKLVVPPAVAKPQEPVAVASPTRIQDEYRESYEENVNYGVLFSLNHESRKLSLLFSPDSRDPRVDSLLLILFGYKKFFSRDSCPIHLAQASLIASKLKGHTSGLMASWPYDGQG